MAYENHYDYVDAHLADFFKACGIRPEFAVGMSVAHGDKCYGARWEWEDAGIPFPKGVCMYLLARCAPYSEEVRDTPNGWVDPFDWVIQNKDRFMYLLP